LIEKSFIAVGMHQTQWTPAVTMKIEGQVLDLEIHGARNNSVFLNTTPLAFTRLDSENRRFFSKVKQLITVGIQSTMHIALLLLQKLL
jgi:hypothetical protein